MDIVAPGENVFSTYIDNNYIYTNGTSVATPYVAGSAEKLGILMNMDMVSLIIQKL
ncbi:S8 family serine peptidase [Peribacillus butanolivorans]|uniref:S8 family serine peptidase n=1 Tax=Peribacillus butanolivorans TaxID=421767 RepID=UPI002467BDDA|nr:S8 family serine peptidase [Peribacillus butanolivorans]